MAKDITERSIADLIKTVDENRKSAREQRFDVAGTKAKDVRAQRKLRRETARILTELSRRSKQ